MKKKISNLFVGLILLLSSVMIIGSNYYATQYPNQDFDQIVYYLLNGVQNTATSVTETIITNNIISVIILFLLLIIVTVKNVKKNIYLKINIKGKEKTLQIFPIRIICEHKKFYTVVVFLIAVIVAIKGFKIDEYIKNNLSETKIYEEYYVDGSTVEITFPEEKRNLVLIVVESMENTVCSKENGGGWEYSIIPELEKLAKENINFSNTELIGGFKQTYGTTYTAGGLVAQTAGIPLITPLIMTTQLNNYTGDKYLENAYTLGDVLAENGYNLEIMMGSNGEFGGRTQYFRTNGNYKIFDLNYVINTGKMTEEEKVWWGFEDDKLFAWAKEEIIDLANQDEPFNLIIETADTHFENGYLSQYAENKFSTQYENVHAYSSKLVYEFVEWIQEQDFYENTTIAIVGDHLGMQDNFYASHVSEDYERTGYNVIINSAIEGTNTKNRQFTLMDIYPTILASIGVKIEGERLGLGTNLYSGKKTLVEELGYKYLDNELRKNSTFYNRYLLGNDYYEMKEHAAE